MGYISKYMPKSGVLSSHKPWLSGMPKTGVLCSHNLSQYGMRYNGKLTKHNLCRHGGISPQSTACHTEWMHWIWPDQDTGVPISNILGRLVQIGRFIFVCVGVMYSGEYDVCDVTLSVHPHRASWTVRLVAKQTFQLAWCGGHANFSACLVWWVW
jgi:hypothetical protein